MKNFIKIIQDGAGQYPLLTPEEEVELADKIKQGDDEAAKRLAGSNVRLVIAISRDYLGCGMTFEQIVSEGFLGLLTAVEKFKPNKGAKFSTYASWWIKQAIIKKMNEQGIIKIPVSTMRKMAKARRLIKKHIESGETEEDAISKTAQEMEVKERTIKSLVGTNVGTVSLQKQVGNSVEAPLDEIIEDEKSEIPGDEMGKQDRYDLVVEMIRSDLLNDREREILLLRCGFNEDQQPYTLEIISDKIGITRERVRQIQNRAIQKIKGKIKEKGE